MPERLLVAALALFAIVTVGLTVSQAQVFDPAEAELTSLRQDVSTLQTDVAGLTATVSALSDALLALQNAPPPVPSLPIPTAAFIDLAPGLVDAAITCEVVADTPTVCNVLGLSGAYDVNGDDLTVTVICDQGTHNGMEYTGPGGDCTFQVSDGSDINPEGQLTVTIAP